MLASLLALSLCLHPNLLLAAQPPAEKPAVAVDVENPWDEGLKGTWQGSIKVGAESLGFVLVIEGVDKVMMAIPDQNLPATPVALSQVGSTTLTFVLKVAGMPKGAEPTFSLTPDVKAGTISGTMTQGGRNFPTTARRLAAGETAGPNRPQTPRGPFAYSTREVGYTSFDGAALNGTLVTPESVRFGPGPYPCVLFITGSGSQDRDETLFGHKPFAVLADDLAKRGIASLRVDDRGFGGAHDPAGLSATSETFGRDVQAGLEWLRAQKEIDAARLGLIGHSEGALIGPAVAVANPSLAFMVMLAGPGVRGLDILTEQMGAMLTLSGMTRERVGETRRLQIAALTLAANESVEEEALREALLPLLRSQMGASGDEAAINGAADSTLKMLRSAWMRHFIARDPAPDLRRVKCPVLVLNGGMDFQVSPTQNVPAVMAALLEGGNHAVTARVFPRCNHLFQPVPEGGNGGVAEYPTIETTIEPLVIEVIGAWVVEVTGGSQGAAMGKSQGKGE